MTLIVDYAFSDYIPPQEQRRRAALRDGLAHVAEMTPHDPAPGEPVVVHFWTSARFPIDRVALYYTVDGSEPDGERGVAAQGTVLMAASTGSRFDHILLRVVRCWEVTLPSQPDGTLVRYRADGWSLRAPQAHWWADAVDPINVNPPRGRLFAYHVDRRHPPDWFRDAIIYQIFVDRFAAAASEPPMHDPGTMQGFFGGTLNGVAEQMEYIAGLGVTMIWLTPIFESPTYHGYNPSSYTEVAARYGGSEALRAVMTAAHARGLRVMLDFVANHTSDEHPRFRAALADPAGPDGRWYTIDGQRPHGYHAFAHVADMPELNTEAPEVRHYLSESAQLWLGDFGADALRLDFASGPSHAFWTVFQAEITAAFPQAVTLGEITATLTEAAAYAGRLDAFMDFSLTKLLRQTFAQRVMPLQTFLHTLLARQTTLPRHFDRTVQLDNHDMHRFLWLAENDTARLRLAAAALLTLDAPPIIYYGTEVSLSQRAGPYGQDAFAREPMHWGSEQDGEMLAWFRALIALRRHSTALRRGALEPLDIAVLTGEAHQVGGFARCTAYETVVVVLNNGLTPAHVAIPATVWQSAEPQQTINNLLTLEEHSGTIVSGDQVEMTLQPFGAAILSAR